MTGHNIMAILLDHRINQAVKVQEVLTNHGCAIKMRMGLHETDNQCAIDGLILLQLTDNNDEIKMLRDDLNAIEGIKAKSLNISWD